VRGRAIRDFLEDLLAGDPVAWIFVGVVLAIGLGLLLLVAFIRRSQRREDEERKERRRRRGY